jgi:hypothetical protein
VEIGKEKLERKVSWEKLKISMNMHWKFEKNN